MRHYESKNLSDYFVLQKLLPHLTPSTEAVFTLRMCDKLRAAIRKNAQSKNRPAPEGRVLVLMVMTVTTCNIART
jgi:hypothetical protein